MKNISRVLAGALIVINAWSASTFADDFASEPVEAITMGKLSESGWTDHVLAFDEVFKVIEVRSMVEFGIGRSTKYFLDKVPEVVSLEIGSTHALQQSLHWYQQCVKKFLPVYPHWRPTFRFCSEELDVATANAWQKGIFPDSLSPSYLQEIADTCAQVLGLADGECMLGFVDSGPYGRVDLVNELLSRKIPIVAAHDTGATGWERQFYAYDRLKIPEQYVEVTFPVRAKITFWLNKDRFSEQDIMRIRQSISKIALLACLHPKK
jgi:hypothetical protein